MTTGEAKMLETETIIFSARTEQNGEHNISIEDAASEIKFDQKQSKIELKERFSKLKKSLRRRSISIL